MPRQILIVTLVFFAVFLPLSALGVRGAGAWTMLATGITVLALTRREGWQSLGLQRPASWPRALLQALGLSLLAYLAAGLAMGLATRGLGLPPADFGRFADLKGNLPALLGMLAISWSSAAVGEELLFRGFLQTRLQTLLGTGKGAGLAAALLQALLFGLAHAYQGLGGIIVTGCVGLVFGLAYWRLRCLWPVMLAHGLVDTLSMLALYAGVLPKA